MTVTFSADPQTDLDAVNQMLLSIGKAPVNTLSVPGINDVSRATTVLYNVTRDVQTRPWWFNRDEHFLIALDTNGNCILPESALDMTPTLRRHPFVLRANPNLNNSLCFWNLREHTFNLTPWVETSKNGTGIHCDMVWCWSYNTLPQAARTYIARRAGREFQTNVLGSQILYQFTKEMELEAAAAMERAQHKDSQTNMFKYYTRNGRIFNRQPGAYRRTW